MKMGEGQANLTRSGHLRWAVWVYVASGMGCRLSLENSGAPAPTRRLPLGSARSRLPSLRLKSPEVGATPQLSSNFCFLSLRVPLGPKDAGPRQAVVAGVGDPSCPRVQHVGAGVRVLLAPGQAGSVGGRDHPGLGRRRPGPEPRTQSLRPVLPRLGAGPPPGRTRLSALRMPGCRGQPLAARLGSAAGTRLPESWGCWAAGPGGAQGASETRGWVSWFEGVPGGERHVGREGDTQDHAGREGASPAGAGG